MSGVKKDDEATNYLYKWATHHLICAKPYNFILFQRGYINDHLFFFLVCLLWRGIVDRSSTFTQKNSRMTTEMPNDGKTMENA